MPNRYTISSRDNALVWPRVPDGDAATVLALYAQGERSQWLSPAEIEGRQLLQLRALLAHCVKTVPYYRERFAEIVKADTPLDMAGWRTIPILTRADLQRDADKLASTAVPQSHGGVSTAQSSGSTGMPVRFQTSAVNNLFYYASNLRHYRWHDYDPAARYASIMRLNETQRALADAGQPVPWMKGYSTGPHYYFDVARPASQQIAWLQDIKAKLVTTYPSNLRNLLDHCTQHDMSIPDLQAVTTMSEPLDADVKAQCLAVLGAAVHDIYSAQEVGIIALQCPDGAGYHAMVESLLVEILDADGLPCEPGVIGRVVVTSLHNFAMPLIRYELGDYAEAGPVCACGRGLPSIGRILGRVRNMLVLPDGQKIWPSFGSRGMTAIAPVRQHQIVQTSISALEVRLVVERPLTVAEETALARHVTARLPTEMAVSFAYTKAVRRAADGKFEDFISLVPGT